MQTTEMATTHPAAPYDVLRAMRCRYEFQGQTCNGRGGDIDWSTPGIRQFKCQKCGSFNVVSILEAASSGR